MTNTYLIRDITLAYGHKTLFNNLDLRIRTGRWTAILGQSGCGKSSLLKVLAGLLPAASCHNPLTHQCAYMAQTDCLLPWRNALENILVPITLTGHSATQFYSKAKKLLQSIGLAEHQNTYPHELSGGMRQRVALARTLIQDKPVILLDEPFSALDALTRHELQKLTASLLKDKTVIIITHDPAEALRLAQDIYILNGSPCKLTRYPVPAGDTPRAYSSPIISQHTTPLYHALSTGTHYDACS